LNGRALKKWIYDRISWSAINRAGNDRHSDHFAFKNENVKLPVIREKGEESPLLQVWGEPIEGS
jgi:hypothetical protein